MYSSLLTQQCTYWPPESSDGVDLPAGDPVEKLCRWQDKIQRMTDTAGREYVSRAEIYTTEELEKDGWIYRGVTELADPVDAGAFRIRDTYRTQDPGGSTIVWKIFAG